MEIVFRPFLKQHKAWLYLQDRTTTHLLYGGSVFSGKSFLGCMWIFSNCLTYPGTRWLIGRSRLSVLKKTTLNTLLEIFRKHNFTAYHLNNSTNTLTFNNGSEIILLDMYDYPNDPDYDRLGSLEISGAFLDELSEISYKGFQVLTSRIRYKHNEYNLTPKLFCASNPYNTWMKRYFYDPHQENRELEHIKFIPALPADNPYSKTPAGIAYLKNLYNTLDHALRQRLLYGDWNFDSDDYSLFKYEKLQQTFYNEVYITTDTKTYLTVDVGDLGSDKTVIGVWIGWNCVKIKKLTKNETTQVVEEINKLRIEYKVPINHIIIDSIGVGAGVASLLKGCIRYMGSNKAINTGYRNIKTELMYKFAEKINNSEVKFNFAYDDDIIQEALLYKKEFNSQIAGLTSKDEIKRKLSRSPDTIDSLYLRAYFDIKQSFQHLFI